MRVRKKRNAVDVEFRPAEQHDHAAIERLVTACWPEDPTMRQLHAIGRQATHTMVALDAGDVVGAASVNEGRFHPTRAELVVVVHPVHRRHGIATALLDALRDRTERPLLARTRPDEEGGLGFLYAKGFRCIMRNRVATIDTEAALPIDVQGLDVRSVDMPVEEAAAAMERQYRAEHASWSPTGEWSRDESIDVFSGSSWVAESTVAAYRSGELIGIGALHGEPIAHGPNELYLSHCGPFDMDDPDAERITGAMLGRLLTFARKRGARLRVEVDLANLPLWSAIEDLRAIDSQDLLLLASE